MNSSIALIVSVLLAIAGYIVKYLNDLKIAQRKDRLDRVNRQLKELYGPLFSLVSASGIAWTAFRSKYRNDVSSYWDSQPAPSKREKEAWRGWMSEVFMPLNLEMDQILLRNADLLIENEVPHCLLLLSAHVAAYKIVLSKWKNADYSENISIINFPAKEIFEYASRSYTTLKHEQAFLLGKVVGRT